MQNNMLGKIIVSLLFFGNYFSFSWGGTVKMRPCTNDSRLAPTNGNTLFLNVSVDGCENETCIFMNGEAYLVEANLTTSFSSKYLMLSLYSIKGVTYPFLMNINVCDYTVFGQCVNSSPGSKFGIKRNVKLLDEAIPGDHLGIIQIQDDAGVTRFCGELDIFMKRKEFGGIIDSVPIIG